MARSGLGDSSFLILAALAGEPSHGYAIRRDIGTITDGEGTISAATMYTALERLTVEGLIEESGSEVVQGRHRRYYALTDRGAQVLDREAKRLERHAAFASQRLRRRAHTVTPSTE